jgi:hypothetical protein
MASGASWSILGQRWIVEQPDRPSGRSRGLGGYCRSFGKIKEVAENYGEDAGHDGKTEHDDEGKSHLLLSYKCPLARIGENYVIRHAGKPASCN